MSETVYDVYIFADYRWQLVRQFKSHQREPAVEYAEFMYREKHVLAYRVVEETHDDEGGQRERKIPTRKRSIRCRPGRRQAAWQRAAYRAPRRG